MLGLELKVVGCVHSRTVGCLTKLGFAEVEEFELTLGVGCLVRQIAGFAKGSEHFAQSCSKKQTVEEQTVAEDY